ncbi:MAG TPA: response regulator [Stellaceae bacterium]|nr:response regulator [Stellaceae bacterium]
MNRPELIQVSEARAIAGPDVALATKPGLASAVTMTDQIDARGPVCIVDDDVWVCDSLRVLLETYGFAVLAFASGVEFLNDDRRRDAKCLVIDQQMPGLDGLDVVRTLQRDGVFLPAILITGRLDAGIARRAGELGVRAILEKPFPVARLVDLVRGTLAPPG